MSVWGGVRIADHEVLVHVHGSAQALAGRRRQRGDPVANTEDDGGQEQGAQGGDKNPQAGLVAQDLLQGQIGHEQGDREPHAGQGRESQDPGQVEAGQARGRHKAQDQARTRSHAHKLADDEARDDRPCDTRGEGRDNGVTAEGYARVRQSEQGDDDVVDVGRQHPGQALVHGHGVDQGLTQHDRRARSRRLAVELGDLTGSVHVRAAHGIDGHEEGDENTSQGGMNARAVQRIPDDDRQEGVRGRAPYAPTRQDLGAEQPQGRTAQSHEVEGVGVERGDHQQGADVVDDGEGQEEGAQAGSPPGADEGEHPQSEGSVRGDDRSPGVRAVGPVGDPQVDDRRDHEASDRGGGRKEGAAGQPQLAESEVAAHVEAHHEEEGGHEALIHPAVEAELHAERANGKGGGRVPEAVVAVPDIGPEQGQGGRDSQCECRVGLVGLQVAPTAAPAQPGVNILGHDRGCAHTYPSG